MGALTHNGEVLQSLPANASQINFDKTGTDLNSTQTEAAIKEVNTKANTLQSEKADGDKVILNKWDSAYSENRNDANKANALFLEFNGWDSNITNFPTEATNQFGILVTVWGNYNLIGDLTAARSQTLILENGNVFARCYDPSLSTPWTAWKNSLIDKHGVYEYNLLVTLAEFDGISSYGAYLNTAYNALQGYINALPNGLLIHIDRMNIGDIAINNPSSRLGNNTNTVGGLLFAQFIACDITNGHSVIRKVDAIGKTYEMIDDGAYSDLTSNVPAAGGAISVNVTIYALLS